MSTTERTSLGTAGARRLTDTTKSPPQMRAVTPRWLLRMLPWVEVPGGTYRVNRRLAYELGGGRITVVAERGRYRVVPPELAALPPLRGFDDEATLSALADRFVQREYAPGEVLAEAGGPADTLYLVAYGKVDRLRTGRYGDAGTLGMLAAGEWFGDTMLAGAGGRWSFTARAATACTVLALDRSAWTGMNGVSAPLRAHIERRSTAPRPPRNPRGEADIALASGHTGEPTLPGTYAAYDGAPREYPLHVAQTVLRAHTRVTDLYNGPADQLDEQLRLTAEALRERQEHEVVNNPGFGLLHNVDPTQRLHCRTGSPTPEDLDALLCRRRRSRLFVAHPAAVAAFRRACTAAGVYPDTVAVDGTRLTAWRGVPIVPCDKIPVGADGTTSVLVMRTGEDDEGVIGLHRTGLDDEYRPGLSVRRMRVGDRALGSYLMSVYFSAAVLVPDALGVLDEVEVGR